MKHDRAPAGAAARPGDPDQAPTLPNTPRSAAVPIGAPSAVRTRVAQDVREPREEPLRPSFSGTGLRSAYTVPRPLAAELRREEAARARGFAAAVIALCVLELGLEPFVTGEWWLRSLTAGALAVLASCAGWVWHLARDPLKYTRRAARWFGVAALLGSTALTYRLGIFSPAPMLTTLGVAFFGLGEDRKLAIGFSAGAAAAYALLALLVATGGLPDVGLQSALVLPPEARVPTVLLVPFVQGMVLYNARLSRRATIEAIQRSNEWFREARQREKQLEEANRDLDALLKLSGGGEIAAYSGATAGRYTLGQRIGRGAMGEVYAATHGETGQPAAVKLLHPSMQDDALLMQRFLREGAAASKLRAPNVVAVFEVGNLEDGAPYIAMELLRGHDLGWHLRRRGQLTIDEVVTLVQQVAAGLEAARRAGVVHRDLKPQNLFLAQQHNAAPIWKILDFGVSRLAGSEGTLTKDVIVGTPGYMSPEQAAGQPATHRSDVFSFGAVIYRALTGLPPFTGPDTPQILYQVVYQNPPRPSALVPGLPADVDLALAIALAKEPPDRFASAVEMAAAFKAAARNALAPELRLHGRTLVAALPWGSGARGELESVLDGDELIEISDEHEPPRR